MLYWLIREYIRKSGRIILFSFLIGLSIFFLLRYIFASYISKIPIGTAESIGIVGAYTLENLPPAIIGELSRGLTVDTLDQSLRGDLATKWKIQDNGKTYLFAKLHPSPRR